MVEKYERMGKYIEEHQECPFVDALRYAGFPSGCRQSVIMTATRVLPIYEVDRSSNRIYVGMIDKTPSREDIQRRLEEDF